MEAIRLANLFFVLLWRGSRVAQVSARYTSKSSHRISVAVAIRCNVTCICFLQSKIAIIGSMYFAVLSTRCMTVSRHCALVTLNYEKCRVLENIRSFNMENVEEAVDKMCAVWYV